MTARSVKVCEEAGRPSPSLCLIERIPMTKIEFLDTLRKALNGQVPPEIISENLTYYESYISDEMRRGRTETEVLEELGDPRLIARTIIDAAGGSGRRASSRSSRQDYYGSAYEEGSYDRGTAHEDDRTFSRRGPSRISRWIPIIILLLALFAVFGILYAVFTAAFRLIFSLRGLWFWIIILILIFALSRRRR